MLYIDHTDDYRFEDTEPRVLVFPNIDGAEKALRAHTATLFAGLNDAEIVEALAEESTRVRLFACTRRRNEQSSIELMPFARAPGRGGGQPIPKGESNAA